MAKTFTPCALGFVKLVLAIDLDSTITRWVRDASEQPPRINLAIVKEKIPRLIDLSVD